MNSIYAITPVNLSLEKIISKTSNLLELGIKTYQYRDKNNDLNIIKNNSKILLELIKENGGELIINDYPEIALEIGADGFHLGFEDYQKKKNQNFLKKHLNLIKENYIKGLSCKWNLELVSNPPEDILEWDYLAVGSFFKSQTKKDILLAGSEMIMKEVLLKTKKPLYSIGGINNENIINLKKIAYSLFLIILLFDLFFCIIFLVFNEYLPWIYLSKTADKSISDVFQVIEISSKLILISGVFQIFDGLQAVVLGVLRGIQDVFIPTVLIFIAYILVGLPVSYYLGLNTYLGVVGIWIGLLIGLVSSSIFLLLRFKYDLNFILNNK